MEIIAGLFYFVATKRPDSVRYSSVAQQHICYCIDDELVRMGARSGCLTELPGASLAGCVMCRVRPSLVQLYEPFFADFGPLNLGKTYRFCQKTKQLLQVRYTSSGGCCGVLLYDAITNALLWCRRRRSTVVVSTCTPVLTLTKRRMHPSWCVNS